MEKKILEKKKRESWKKKMKKKGKRHCGLLL
jgi:hypothetical protein